MNSIGDCVRCGKPATRYNLVTSPNAGWLKGTSSSYSTVYHQHREKVIQADTHQWERLCADCFSKAHLGALRLVPAQVGPDPSTFIVHKVKSSTQPNKWYTVTIYPYQGPQGRIECNCPWGQYTSNQDQGKTAKYCKHAITALKEVTAQNAVSTTPT